jgi:uncharacterized membrane protein (UPF0127 family)
MIKKIALVFCLVLLSASCGKQNQPTGALSPATPQNNYTYQLKIGGQTLMVEIATTPAQMQQGLSGRMEMADNQGMLFDFGQQTTDPAFWMKDMKFNLDFIWIAGGKVVGITPDVSYPNSADYPLPTYSPPQPVNQVLEVNAGWANKNNIAVGDEVNLQQ